MIGVGAILLAWFLVVVCAHIYSNYFNKEPTGLIQQQPPQISGDTADLVSISPIAGQTLLGTQTIIGSLSGGYFFEANARGILLDANKNVISKQKAVLRK